MEGNIILIVCEGAKTEPIYFNSILREWKLKPAFVRIYGKECGTNPLGIVRFAKDKKKAFEKEKIITVDQTWCVFDQEGVNRKPDFLEALDMARVNRFNVALSAPSFELWYLLHFIYTTRDFSRCNDVVKELKKSGYIPNYKKNEDYINILLPRIDTAKQYSIKLRKHCRQTQSECPYTDVDLLIDELQKLKVR